MLSLAHSWSRRQKAAIMSVGVCGFLALAALIYLYESHYRGPWQEVLYGTWVEHATDSDTYLDLRSNGRFVLRETSLGEVREVGHGRWYAGGTKIYLGFDVEAPADWPLPPKVLDIVDIQSDELRIRWFHEGKILTLRRVRSFAPNASNQAMQRTAGSFAFPLSTTSTFNPQPSAPSPAVADLVSR
jgi:hypothetical protein